MKEEKEPAHIESVLSFNNQLTKHLRGDPCLYEGSFTDEGLTRGVTGLRTKPVRRKNQQPETLSGHECVDPPA